MLAHYLWQRTPRGSTADGAPRITDPMLELWLKSRGLTPDSGDEHG